MALVEGGDICIIPPRRNQAAAKIDAKAFELLGKKDISVKDVHKADHSEWLQSELLILLENTLTQSLSLELETQTRKYELLETKFGNKEMETYEHKDKISDLANEKKSWQARNTELMDKNDAHQHEIEDLLQKLQNMSQNDAETTKNSNKQLEEVRKAQRAKLTAVRDELEMRERELEATQNAMGRIDNEKIALKEELKQKKIECERLENNNSILSGEAANAREVIQNKADNDGRASMAERENNQLRKDMSGLKRQQTEVLSSKREVETQLSGYRQELSKAQNNVKAARGRIDTLQAEVDRLTEEANDLRTRGGAEARSININMGGTAGGDNASLQAQLNRVKAEAAEQKHEFEDCLERKDRMLNEVKDALKGLGLKLGNLDSKTAIPKLKALLSILTKQVQEYKGRQRELQHLLKARLNEIKHLKLKLNETKTQLVAE